MIFYFTLLAPNVSRLNLYEFIVTSPASIDRTTKPFRPLARGICFQIVLDPFWMRKRSLTVTIQLRRYRFQIGRPRWPLCFDTDYPFRALAYNRPAAFPVRIFLYSFCGLVIYIDAGEYIIVKHLNCKKFVMYSFSQ